MKAIDPFKIDGLTAISFSGGRTSAYMLWRVLQANDGKLPEGVEVCFANTGKEMEETLEFVRDCGSAWNVPIRWVEYRADEAGYALVDFNTASRNGEPFAALIAKRQYLPNPVTRFCTVELKIRAMHKHLKSLGWKDGDGWDQMVGIRADEQRRVSKIRARPSPETVKETMILPLADAGVTKKDVGNFWRAQPFDLKLHNNNNGVTMHGNCDLCFLKGANQVFTLIKEKPSRAIWWAAQEAIGLASKPSGARFRSDRPSYQQMQDYARDQDDMFDEEEAIACFCGD
ncbi:phosphoadenosine phosphosulfate reductase family protein [Massilia sp. CCM 8734]|uniref:phosphoadenosine phosphosulfate reductase domain-containing protein n=1 Tax=Massilia sp. CCM 8734 TaxID=2609283 RepID=UPI00141E43FD|nr:phosphoadenosine phosphosulfate reductase family protein [Massilia sp. CCM 8734]NHZ99028.1 phosphoadenosine phosphosulfate reductase family protein [Massilia sp. CCM 8734]